MRKLLPKGVGWQREWKRWGDAAVHRDGEGERLTLTSAKGEGEGAQRNSEVSSVAGAECTADQEQQRRLEENPQVVGKCA